MWNFVYERGEKMRQNPDLILREIYGKNILMPIRFNEASNDPIYFNEVGALIWKLSDLSLIHISEPTRP